MDAPTDYAAKKRALFKLLSELRSVAVAFSGGVDSGVLLHAALEVLGDRCSAVIADSASLPRRELAEALSRPALELAELARAGNEHRVSR